MADILKHGTNRPFPRLLPQQQILNTRQRSRISIIDKMIPAARIPIQHGGSLHPLPPIGLAPLTLERIVRIARRARFELKQLPERIEAEMSLDVLGAVDDA